MPSKRLPGLTRAARVGPVLSGMSQESGSPPHNGCWADTGSKVGPGVPRVAEGESPPSWPNSTSAGPFQGLGEAEQGRGGWREGLSIGGTAQGGGGLVPPVLPLGHAALVWPAPAQVRTELPASRSASTSFPKQHINFAKWQLQPGAHYFACCVKMKEVPLGPGCVQQAVSVRLHCGRGRPPSPLESAAELCPEMN